jgi:hypothetical protein
VAESIEQQVELLGERLETLSESVVTRREFDELKQMLAAIKRRLDDFAPTDQIPDEHLAIMSAVFAATIGKRFKIRQVKQVEQAGSWAQAGRVNLHAQRHVRRS